MPTPPRYPEQEYYILVDLVVLYLKNMMQMDLDIIT